LYRQERADLYTNKVVIRRTRISAKEIYPSWRAISVLCSSQGILLYRDVWQVGLRIKSETLDLVKHDILSEEAFWGVKLCKDPSRTRMYLLSIMKWRSGR
jgi:hypothetical protein